MRAGFIEAPLKAMFRDDMAEPQITAANQVKIQVKVSGICGSEVHAYHGKHAWRVPPLVSGHEFSGVVAEVGQAVTSCKVGDRVTAEPQYGCGHCGLCQEGRYNLCAEKKILGATYWSGSFGEYVVVPEQCVIPLATGVSFEEGALIEPLAVGMHAVRTHKVSREDTIAVIGCGTIGLGVILCAGCYSPKKIIGIDVVDFNLEKAREMGADVTFNSLNDQVTEEIMKLTDGQGVDIAFLAFGNAACVKQAAEITKRGGIIAEIAVMGNDVVAPFNMIQVKELQMIGSNMFTAKDFKAVINGIANGKIKLEGFVTKRFPIEQMHDAMEYADKRPEPQVKVVLEF
jgi:L-iditol 2-dehydrogenase